MPCALRPQARRRPHARLGEQALHLTAGALLRYGEAGRLTTTVLSARLPDETGTLDGNIALRGGGDPTFNAASTAALAKQSRTPDCSASRDA